MLGAQYLRLVLSRWRLVAALVVGGTLVAWLFSVLVLAQNPKFQAAARFNIVPTSEELGYANRFVRGSTFDGGSTLLGTYAEFAHTRPVVAPIVDRFVREQAQAAGQTEAAWIAANTGGPSLSPSRLLSILNYGAAPALPLKQDMIDELIEKTVIETVEGTYLMRLTVEWDDPVAAAWFANALADAIIARAERMSSKTGTQIADTLAVRLAEKQAELDGVLRRSRDMKTSVGVVDVDRQKQSLLEAQIAEQSQLTNDRAQYQGNQSQVAGLRSQTGGRMSTAQAAIEERLAVEGPRTAGLKRGIAIREGRVAQIRGQITALGRHEDTIRSLDDRALQLRAEVAALTERVSFSQTENLANAPRIQLIERAVPPIVRSSPKTFFNTVLGFIAGCALAGCALLLLGEAPARVREEVAEVEVEPVAQPEPKSDPAPPRPIRVAPQAAPPLVRPSVVDIPRAMPAAVAPVFATSGALALARDERSEPDVVADAPIPVRAEPVEAPPSLVSNEEERHPSAVCLQQPLRTGFDKLSANGDRVGSVSIAPPLPAPPPLALAPEPVALEDRIFAYLLPPPRNARRYGEAETRGIGTQVATWLGAALASARPLTIAATGDAADAQRLYQLLHDYRAAIGDPVVTVDWSGGAGALPRAEGKPLIYAGGGFGGEMRTAHRDGAVVVAIRGDDVSLDALEAEARRLATAAGRPVHVIPLGG